MLNFLILDGYVDEPSCLGVPPYISPYPRYIAGAIWDYDKSIKISYLTIDQIRNKKNLEILSKFDVIIVIAGMAVPGRYLSGFPASPNELVSIMSNFSKPLKILIGPAAKYGFGLSGGKRTRSIEEIFNLTVKGDGEIVISNLLKNNFSLEKI